jgi:hypothetical protein
VIATPQAQGGTAVWRCSGSAGAAAVTRGWGGRVGACSALRTVPAGQVSIRAGACRGSPREAGSRCSPGQSLGGPPEHSEGSIGRWERQGGVLDRAGPVRARSRREAGGFHRPRLMPECINPARYGGTPGERPPVTGAPPGCSAGGQACLRAQAPIRRGSICTCPLAAASSRRRSARVSIPTTAGSSPVIRCSMGSRLRSVSVT